MPIPLGKSAVDAWTQDEPEATDGNSAQLEPIEGGATQAPEDTSGLAAGSSSPQQAAGGLDGRRTNLIAVLVGMLAVLLVLRWALSVRGRQHYPRS